MPDDQSRDPEPADAAALADRRPRRPAADVAAAQTRSEVEPLDARVFPSEVPWPSDAMDEPLDLVERQRQARLHAQILGEEPPALCVGRFTILEKLGEGGMGTVYAAYDGELDRRVALKFLHPTRALDERATHRLLREAQALAKLSHPNLVPVFDVGRFEDQVYLAMELVPGATMRRWLEAAPRSWREVLRHGIDVARAVAAVHRLGIIHRDIKPDNIIIGDDGRARLLDFGLARAPREDGVSTPRPDDSASGAPPRSRLGVVITHTHTFAGTPAYMAPEARLGETAGAAADQYSLCVALAEALYGARPIGPVHGTDLLKVPAKSTVPGALRRILSRGLAEQPEHRCADVAQRADALDRIEGRRRRRPGAAVLGLALVAAAGIGAAGGDAWRPAASAPDPCTEVRTALDATWNPHRRGALAGALAATALPDATTLAEVLAARVDTYASAWTDARAQVCEATWRRGEQSATLLDQRMACLDDARGRLDALLSAVAAIDAEQVPRLPTALDQLGDPSECVGVASAAERGQPVPADRIEDVAAGFAELARLRTAVILGGPATPLEPLEAALAHAEQLEVAPLVAATTLAIGHAHLAARDPRATPYLERAANLAETLGDDDLREEAVRAAARVAIDVDADASRARALVDRDAALLERIDASPRRRAAAAEVRALLSMLEGDATEAERTLRGALSFWEQAGDHHAGAHASCWRNLGRVLGGRGRTDEALAAFDRAAQIEARWGGVPATLSRSTLPGSAQRLRGEALMDAGRLDEAASALDAARQASAEAFGRDSVPVGIVEVARASLAMRVGDLDAALERASAADASFTRWLGRDHAMRASPLSALGTAAFHLHRDDEAIAAFTEALRLWQRSFADDSLQVAEARSNLGEALAQAGRDQEAAVHLQAALAAMAARLPEDHPDLAYPLLGLAQLEYRRGEPAAAVAHAERAMAIREAQGDDPPELARTRWLLARALAELDQRARARAVAERAREGFAGLGPAFARDVAAIDAWMTTEDEVDVRASNAPPAAERDAAIRKDRP
ncbi:MAG: serine/threonine protein kinase [Deltaproteobacteria bacterium]|nr:serine/threonine protein kinase [Deltaproteobacteria bacterium]